MKTTSLLTRGIFAVSLAIFSSVAAQAAVRTVPGTHSSIYDAVTNAQNGDEIRVSNNHEESLGWIPLQDKSISIISYDPAFQNPTRGATWNVDLIDSDVKR